MAVGPPPLTGLKVLEFAGLAPGPFAGLLLADAGASVLRVDRAGPAPGPPPVPDLLSRRKASLPVDLRSPGGAALVRALAARAADVLIDPFRPGVLERLGLGPGALCALNPRLVYARLTGFRRRGDRWSDAAGHDINYLAVSGVLALLGRRGAPPTPPANLLADFAGGGAQLVQGVLLALLVRERTGRGQVVEASMADGAAYLATFPRALRGAAATAPGAWDRPRGENLLDSGCPYYDCYATRDEGGWVAVGALEDRFFAALLRGLGLEGRGWEAGRRDRARWPALRRALAAAFRGRTRAEWEAVFAGTDACCTPVRDFAELEAGGAGAGGDQRPPVGLRATPLLAVHRGPSADPGARGQGPGVPGDGYEGHVLAPGEGAEEALGQWLGWARGVQFDVEEGGAFVPRDKARL